MSSLSRRKKMMGLRAAGRVDFGWDGVDTNVFFRTVLEFFERRGGMKKQACNANRTAANVKREFHVSRYRQRLR